MTAGANSSGTSTALLPASGMRSTVLSAAQLAAESADGRHMLVASTVWADSFSLMDVTYAPQLTSAQLLRRGPSQPSRQSARAGADSEEIAGLYRRVANGWPAHQFYLSEKGLEAFGALAGRPLREIVRGLPGPD